MSISHSAIPRAPVTSRTPAHGARLPVGTAKATRAPPVVATQRAVAGAGKVCEGDIQAMSPEDLQVLRGYTEVRGTVALLGGAFTAQTVGDSLSQLEKISGGLWLMCTGLSDLRPVPALRSVDSL